MKIIHPHGERDEDDLQELLEFAMEGRRRVKEQLKKMGSFEYYQTSFSYTIDETGEERFVGVPEQGGRDLISLDPLAPGTAYTAGTDADGTVGMFRIEVSVSGGTGKLKTAGGVRGPMKESVQRAFSYMQANKASLELGAIWTYQTCTSRSSICWRIASRPRLGSASLLRHFLPCVLSRSRQHCSCSAT